MAWVYRNLNPLSKNTGDCVVRAIAYATNQTWDDTFWGIAEEGFLRAEMPSWNANWWSYLEKQGFKRHIIPDTCPDCYTVRDFCRDHPYGTYVLAIPSSSRGVGHVIAVRSGNYMDTWDSGSEIPLVYWEKGENK